MIRATALALGVWIAMVGCVALGADQPEYQEMTPGQIPLVSILNLRVGYGIFGGAFKYLTPGQLDDDASGAQFSPRGSSVFMHPAWKLGAGFTVAEFFVHLPKIAPLKFTANLGLDPSAVGKSDGVTYRVYAGEYLKRKILFERNVTDAGPVPCEVDLSAYAGQDLILGLECHPGPKEDTGYDWTYWYEPKLIVGTGPLVLPALPDEVKTRLTALYAQGVKPFANDRTSTKPSPGPLASGTTEIKKLGDRKWSLSFHSPQWQVDYDADLSDGRLDGIVVRRGKDKPWFPCAGGGLEIEAGGVTYLPEAPEVKRTCLDAKADGDGITARYRYVVGERTVDWTLHLALDGPYLRLEFASESQGVAGMRLGGPTGFRRGMPIFMPYMGFSDVMLINDGFASYVPDLWTSSASWGSSREVQYQPRSDHQRNALRERAWVGYVPVAEMAIQNIPNPPSPYLADMSARPVMDVWGGKFGDISKRLQALAAYGIDHTFIILHDWQHAGYDVQLPDTLPAREEYGGDAAMRELCQTANGIGHRICVHENYVDMYPDAPSWNEADVALDSAGKWINAWYQPGTKIQSFLIKPLHALKIARRFAPDIHKRYGTTGAYLDVHSAVMFWDKVDFDAREPGAAMFTTTLKAYGDLWALMRKSHDGPVTGEGNNHAYWAGLFDGAEAQVTGGENTTANVAFDLCKVHPQNINHGMGYWSRWTTGTAAAGLPGITLPITIDKYRAQEITFAHAGFLGSEFLSNDYTVAREYYLTRWLQEKYGIAALLNVAYEVGGKEVSLSEALMRRAPMERLHITYDGLDVWANWGGEPWVVQGRTLPQWGYLAQGSNGLLQYCAERDGVVCDYMQTGDVMFADGRARIEQMTTASQVIDVAPKVASFKQTGPRKFEITYEWACHAPTKRDATIFVHYTTPLAGGDEKIALVGDYKPTPTLPNWEAGKTYVGGPFTVELPEQYAKPGTIGINVGIYDDSSRALLAEAMVDLRKVHLGDIKIEGEGDAMKLTFVPAELTPIDLTAALKLMQAHTNPGEKAVDFGPVVTSSCVILRREGDRLRLIAVPRDEKIRVGLRMDKLPEAWKGVKPPAGASAPDNGVTWVEVGG